MHSVSSKYSYLHTGNYHDAIDSALGDIGQKFGAHLIAAFELDSKAAFPFADWRGSGNRRTLRWRFALPHHCRNRIEKGRIVSFSSILNISEGSVADYLKQEGVVSGVAIPFGASDTIHGFLAIMTNREAESWSLDRVRALRIAANIISNLRSVQINTLANRRADHHRRIALREGMVFTWEMNVRTWKITFLDTVPECFKLDRSPCSFSDILRITHPEDRNMVICQFRNATRTEKPFSFEFRFLSDNDEYRWVTVAGSSRIDDYAYGKRLVGTAIDITDRKRNELKLRRKSAFTDVVTMIATNFINMPVEEIDSGINEALEIVISLTRMDRVFVYMLDDAGLLQCVYQRSRYRNSGPIRISKDIDLDTAYPWLAGMLRDRQTLSLKNLADLPEEASCFRSDLIYAGVASLKVASLMSGERLIGFIGIASKRPDVAASEDFDDILTIIGEIITNANDRLSREKALRRSEASLLESEKRFRALYDLAGDGIFLISDNVIVDCNHRAEHIFCCFREDIVGKTPMELSPEIQRDGMNSYDSARRRIENAMSGSPQLFEWQHVRNGAEIFDAEVRLNRIVLSDGVYLIATVRDITERVQTQRIAEIQKKQLSQASKMISLGTLISGFAHEVNNPNNYIRLNAQGLDDLHKEIFRTLDAWNDSDEDARLGVLPYSRAKQIAAEMLGGMLEGSKRIEKLISNLKSFARDREGNVDQIVNLCEAAMSAIQLVQIVISKSTNHFTMSVPSTPIYVIGNYHQLEQVIINLMTNACQSLESPQKKINLSVELDHIRREACVFISDEGIGIEEEDLPYITDPFFTRKRDQGGTGLGLSVSYQIVQNHGGRLTFESAVGVGTIARIFIPLHKESRKHDDTQPADTIG